MLRRHRKPLLLLGDSGIGKATIIEALALKTAQEEIASLAGLRILRLDLTSLLRLAKEFDGDWIAMTLAEELKQAPDLLLYIDDLQILRDDYFLKKSIQPLLLKEGIAVIGTATADDWDYFLSHEARLAQSFTIIKVFEPSESQAKEMLRTRLPFYEAYYQINYDPAVVDTAVDMAKRYLTSECLPASAFSLMDDAGAFLGSQEGQPTLSDRN